MNLLKVSALFVLVFSFLSREIGECQVLQEYMSSRLCFDHLQNIRWTDPPTTIFLTSLLVKLLSIENITQKVPSAAVGALLINQASAVMQVTIDLMNYSLQLNTPQYVTKTEYPPNFRTSPNYLGRAVQHPRYKREAPRYTSGMDRACRKLGMINRDVTPEIEKLNLIPYLREAYFKLKLSKMDDLSFNRQEGFPNFIPFPEIMSKLQNARRIKRSSTEGLNVVKSMHGRHFMMNLIRELKGFFTILTAFDPDACVQKLVCEVHAKASRSMSLLEYERSLVSMFKFVNAMLAGDYQGTSIKYRFAARFGELNNHPDACKQRYQYCDHTSKQLYKMGELLNQPQRGKNLVK